MLLKLGYITTLLTAGAAVTAIAAAPPATADPAPVEQSCTYLGVSQTQCQAPGNVQINDNPVYDQDTSQYPYWEGDVFHHGRR
jgi:hypothetical protein